MFNDVNWVLGLYSEAGVVLYVFISSQVRVRMELDIIMFVMAIFKHENAISVEKAKANNQSLQCGCVSKNHGPPKTTFVHSL